MRHALVAIFILMLSGTMAWASCDEIYTKRVDYLKGTGTIIVRVHTTINSDRMSAQKLQSLSPKFVKAIVALVPKEASVKVINYAEIDNIYDSSATIFNFIVHSWQEGFFIHKYYGKMSLYLSKNPEEKDLVKAEGPTFKIEDNNDENEKYIFNAVKTVSQDTVNTIVCLKDKICPLPENCNDTYIKPRSEIKNENDAVKFMKSLEKK